MFLDSWTLRKVQFSVVWKTTRNQSLHVDVVLRRRIAATHSVELKETGQIIEKKPGDLMG